MPIKVSNLFYTYLPKSPIQTEALRGVSLEIESHSFCGILGQTGSGKSTLIQTLNALLIPTQGEVRVDEFLVLNKKNKNKKIKQLRKHLAIVFQFPEYQLFEETVEKDVAFGAKNFGASKEEALKKAHQALISVGLDESYFKRSPFELSGGEKRRVAIAGILAIEPDILVLDEPTAGLDPKGATDIMSLVEEMYNQGKSIILVTHDMDLVLKYCQKVFVLKEGLLVFEGTPGDLFRDGESNFSIEIPLLFQYAKKLKNRGLPIDINRIKETQDLIKQIKEWKQS
jgi:energy-coupling factor transport system ATP-binding protein